MPARRLRAMPGYRCSMTPACRQSTTPEQRPTTLGCPRTTRACPSLTLARARPAGARWPQRAHAAERLLELGAQRAHSRLCVAERRAELVGPLRAADGALDRRAARRRRHVLPLVPLREDGAGERLLGDARRARAPGRPPL